MFRHIFRKTPLAWLQLSREKTRLAIALAGIGFADILMFVQLGFKDALFDAAIKPHQALKADLVIVNPQLVTLFSPQSFKRERLYQAAGFEGVKSVSYLYLNLGQWRNPDTRVERSILIFGTDPGNSPFNIPEVSEKLNEIQKLNHVIFDRDSRPEFGEVGKIFTQKGIVETELNKVRIEVSGLFSLGASFAADGNVIVSDSTFLRLFPTKKAEEIEIGLITLQKGTDVEKMQASMQDLLNIGLPKERPEVKVYTVEEFAAVEKQYWAESTAIGFIFGFGTVVGFIVGIVIVYQILYSDVSDHLPEYATLKAMGYTDFYLIKVLIQESLILAILGFLPGFIISFGLYNMTQSSTNLPIGMKPDRAVTVLSLTVVMCSASAIIAMRKLQEADPADIF